MLPTPASETSHRQSGLWFAALVVGLFFVYNANFRPIGPLDSIPSTLLPASLLLDGDTDLAEFDDMLENAGVRHGTRFFGTLQDRGDRVISSYPLGAAIVALPLYVVPVYMEWLDEWSDYELMGKLAASLIVALSAGFLFLSAEQIAGARTALLLALAYGLATNAWSVASQALWQHGPGMLCLSVALLLLVRLERGAGVEAALGAGVALGFAVLCRSLNAVPAGALGLFVLSRHRRYVFFFAAPLVAAVCWQGWYNHTTFGDLRGGYDAILQSPWHRWRGLTNDNFFAAPFWRGLANILLSPGKGLLIYTPYMALGLVALVPASTARDFPLGRFLALWVVLLLIPLSKNTLWWGGSAYGPRYLCEALLPLSLVLAWSWRRFSVRTWLRAAFTATLALSLGVQVVGAFFAPCGWHETPVYVDRHPGRLWDWSDTQIERCVSVGLREGPKPFVFLEGD